MSDWLGIPNHDSWNVTFALLGFFAVVALWDIKRILTHILNAVEYRNKQTP